MVSTPHSVFLHIPRTGGTWVTEAMLAGVGGTILDSNRIHTNLEVHKRYPHHFSFTFVRNPLDWYRSYWCRRMMFGWTREPIDQDCAGVVFREFIDNIFRMAEDTKYYQGFVSRLYLGYQRIGVWRIGYCGRQEYLADDLITALKTAGDVYDEDAIRATPRANTSDYHIFNSYYRQDQAERMAELEKDAMEQFGYSIREEHVGP